MNTRYSLMSTAIVLFLGVALLSSCNAEGNNFDFEKNGLLMTGTEINPVQKLVVEDTPSAYNLTVKATRKVDQDTKVELSIDTAAFS